MILKQAVEYPGLDLGEINALKDLNAKITEF